MYSIYSRFLNRCTASESAKCDIQIQVQAAISMRKLYCQNHIVKICGPRLLLCLTAPPQYPLELRFHPQNKLMQKILQNGYHTARMSLIGRVLRRRQECHTLRGGCLAMLGCIHLSLCRAFCKQAALWSSHLKNSVEKMSKTICSCPNCA